MNMEEDKKLRRYKFEGGEEGGEGGEGGEEGGEGGEGQEEQKNDEGGEGGEGEEGGEGGEGAEDTDPMVVPVVVPVDGGEGGEGDTKKDDEGTEMCCCCICECSNEKTKKLSCCACFPLKCGVIFIGIFYIMCSIALLLELFWTLLNEYIHWWYFLVGFILLLPFIVGDFFIIAFFTKDGKTQRTMLYSACILALASVACLGIWNVIYFYYFYKYDMVYAGMDVVGYTTQSKKAFIVWSMFLAFCFDFLFAYFQCVCSLYATTMDGKPPKKKKGEGVFGAFG